LIYPQILLKTSSSVARYTSEGGKKFESILSGYGKLDMAKPGISMLTGI
jgi:hypothetical protein